MKRSHLLVIASVILLVGAGLFFSANNSGQTPIGDNQEMDGPIANNENSMEDEQMANQDGKNPIVTILMESGNEIQAELYPDIAPNTVNNFLSLARSGFYDGTIFHRVIPGFMIQGGDPEGTGRGGPGYSIRGEFTDNGFRNDLKHTRGVLSMARTQIPDSAGSQFFIMVADSPHLDRQYASFGRVISGMDEVDRIVSTRTNPADRPLEDQRIEKVTVEQFGVEYPEPTTIP